MAPIALAFLWHQHQPYYPDDVAGENPMPWVRLHGVKDYYGMALHLLEYPEMQCTINLVPSLVLQLQAYTEGATDRFLDVSRFPADGLSQNDCLFLLDHFFMASHEQMIRPYPRYHELLMRRGPGNHPARDALRRFAERDYRDLQVWFNLTWIHPLAIEQDPDLMALMTKGRFFSEEDKALVLTKQFEILNKVLPLHKQLADSGQVELTTTPYFHPILPLLFDKKLAREAMPDVKLPQYTGGYLDDAEVHVRRAVEQHERVFGKAPRGMWPAEGSVCQTMLPLLRQYGIRWIATDEEILSASTQGFVSRDGKGHVINPDRMYRPYKVREGDSELGIVFRDHALSDMIGFHYQRGQGEESAEDFVNRVRSINQAVGHGEHPALVSVILDGENCWEHYQGGGVDFLRALYEKCSQSSDIQPVKVGEFLERYPPRDTLPRLFAGSWISHNFAIWIGHEEDNTAWDALHKTREYLRMRNAEYGMRNQEKPDSLDSTFRVPRSALERAWEEMYIAEGSDWFWWYGDDHSSAQDALFDYLFRKHLQNVYLLLGDQPPPELSRPISRKGHKAFYTLPRAFLDVKINGRKTFFEWLSAGHYVCQNERGTMAMTTRGPMRELHFGFNPKELFVRIDFDRRAREALDGFDALRLGFIEPAGWEIVVAEPGRIGQTIVLNQGGRERPAADVRFGIDQIAEFAVPFERLGVKVNEPVQFFVELLEGKQSVDRAPREGTIALMAPSPDFELIMWDV